MTDPTRVAKADPQKGTAPTSADRAQDPKFVSAEPDGAGTGDYEPSSTQLFDDDPVKNPSNMTNEEIQNLVRLHKLSTSEGKRLAQESKEKDRIINELKEKMTKMQSAVEPAMQFQETLQKHPELGRIIYDYLERGSLPPGSDNPRVDFSRRSGSGFDPARDFDPADIVDQNTESGKWFAEQVQTQAAQIAKSVLDDYRTEETQKARQMRVAKEIDEVAEEMGIDRSEVISVLKEARNRPFSVRDVMKVHYEDYKASVEADKGKEPKNIFDLLEEQERSGRPFRKPRSLGTSGSAPNEKQSFADRLMNDVKKRVDAAGVTLSEDE